MYVCGITPYDSTHLGHAATYLTYDLLTRRLETLGHTVHMVRNITDVDDSILPKARAMGVDFPRARRRGDGSVPRRHGGARYPSAVRRAAPDRVDADIIEMIRVLADRGFTYHADGITYFDVTKAPRFGQLSHYSRDQMIQFARERGGHPDDPRQRDPLDFVLWQPSLGDEPAWDSPFGSGRPGWHIECSAMSKSVLGTPSICTVAAPT
jgi:L-cysteine:1D-myo-inositol 2-amino-2-deoxy-alpha-D-glucopyranoside ligase